MFFSNKLVFNIGGKLNKSMNLLNFQSCTLYVGKARPIYQHPRRTCEFCKQKFVNTPCVSRISLYLEFNRQLFLHLEQLLRHSGQ